MNRREELKRIIETMDDSTKIIAAQAADELFYLEEKLKELKKLPSIAVNPKRKTQQKVTAAGKQYKEYLQQYSNLVKLLCGLLGNDTDDNQTSALRESLLRLAEKYAR